MIVYLRRRPLLPFSVVHTNIPLRLSLRNYSTVRHLPAVHCGTRTSGPSQSYARGGGLATAAQMSHRTPRYHRRRVRTAAADPRWYRSRCCYRCTAAGTTGYHSRCHRCDPLYDGGDMVCCCANIALYPALPSAPCPYCCCGPSLVP